MNTNPTVAVGGNNSRPSNGIWSLHHAPSLSDGPRMGPRTGPGLCNPSPHPPTKVHAQGGHCAVVELEDGFDREGSVQFKGSWEPKNPKRSDTNGQVIDCEECKSF